MIKDHETAAKVLAAAFQAFSILDQSIHHVISYGAPEEVTRYKRAVGSVMGAILDQILNPVIAAHPDLEPESWRAGRRDV